MQPRKRSINFTPHAFNGEQCAMTVSNICKFRRIPNKFMVMKCILSNHGSYTVVQSNYLVLNCTKTISATHTIFNKNLNVGAYNILIQCYNQRSRVITIKVLKNISNIFQKSLYWDFIYKAQTFKLNGRGNVFQYGKVQCDSESSSSIIIRQYVFLSFD